MTSKCKYIFSSHGLAYACCDFHIKLLIDYFLAYCSMTRHYPHLLTLM